MARLIRDTEKLLPSFQPKVRELLAAMKARGWPAIVWETLRSPERAAMLQRTGKSKNGAKSMHCHGAAVDILHAKDMWGNRQFFRDLGEEAEKLGLTWGGDWDHNPDTKERFYDGPHVQALRVAQQNEFRALKPEDRDQYIAGLLVGEVSHATTQPEAAATAPAEVPTAEEEAAQACLPRDES